MQRSHRPAEGNIDGEAVGGGGCGEGGGGGGRAGMDIQPYQIIIGFVRQHLLCQHSSRQPRGGRAKIRLQSSERHKDRQKQGQTQEGETLRSVWTLWSSPPCLCERRV